MTNPQTVLHAWASLPPEVRDLAAPIRTEEQYREALATFEAVWNEVGGQVDHPLGSLFELLRDRITAYEDREHPVRPAPAHRVLAFLMAQRGMTQIELAEVLGITQGNVSRLLSGKTALSVEAVRKLAAYFHVSPEVFLSGA
ncbi:type II toxin-antitoxin system HigA family antitoxin [Deinococcus sp. S9]|uniref:helix-turn-helix domain-containing protein n=1 Tax=Deinococcus sp. S9 TaxID=2545754 RepID=UPI0010569751|nr:helix-turn-helix domain-containing protein [Deinococcus sp. S9]TDE85040.1 helix-turn-helix domain-containing protein [Deinococcus sp. S9]